MKKKQLVIGLIFLVVLAAIFIWGHDKMHFDLAAFRAQLSQANWAKIGIGLACIYLAYVLRAMRWALLLRHNKKVPLFSLIGTQVIGFTGVALIGRIADPVRPILVSKKTGLPVSNQIAVYIVERLFDAGSMALIFSIAMLWIPDTEILRATSHSGIVSHLMRFLPIPPAWIARYTGLALTVLGALFLVAVRVLGNALATFAENAFGLISKNMGQAIGNKIRTFHSGLDTMRTLGDFLTTTTLSVGMWVLISLAYLETVQAFTASPQLAAMSPSKCVLLMVVSGGASIIQLPVIGWFTQIGLVATAITNFFGASVEASTACAATLLLTTFLGIVPIGLIWAQIENVSFRKIAAEGDQTDEEIEVAQ